METLISLVGPLHPPLVHFAVACPILAFFALAAQRVLQKEWLGQAAVALWFLAFLTSLAAGVTGHFFSVHLGLETQLSILPPESASQGRLREHVLLGSGSMLLSIAVLFAAIRTFREKPLPRNTQLWLALTAALLAGWTGHEGGEMVYGSDNAAASSEAAQEKPQTGDPAHSPASVKSTEFTSLFRDYRKTLTPMNSRPWNSRTHGHRWVNTFVSKDAVTAYQKSDPLPEGSQVVKESFEDAGGKPSGQAGPLYVMVKGPAAASPRTGGWRYALVWDKPVPNNPENILSPVQWLPGDPHLNSCVKCHNHFKLADYLGGIPEGFENK